MGEVPRQWVEVARLLVRLVAVLLDGVGVVEVEDGVDGAGVVVGEDGVEVLLVLLPRCRMVRVFGC